MANANATSVTANNDVAVDGTTTSSQSILLPNHGEMMEACAKGDLAAVIALLETAAADGAADDADAKSGRDVESSAAGDRLDPSHLLAAQQDPSTGLSPLMVASRHGHLDVCKALLEAAAPWNAVDRYGKCAGDYATDNSHWNVVNYLVEEGTKAEASSTCI